jgi:hypothetical protein
MMDFTNFRARMKDKTLTDYGEIASIILKLDARLIDWPEKLDTIWSFKTKRKSKSAPEILGDYYFLYYDLYPAGLWNSYRCVHMMVIQTIMEGMTETAHLTFPAVSPTYISVYKSYKASIAKLCSEICASLYYHMYNSDQESATVVGPALGGYYILWGLFSVAMAGKISPIQKEWALDRLLQIGNTMGIQHAIGLVEMMKKIPAQEPSERDMVWERLDALGDKNGMLALL